VLHGLLVEFQHETDGRREFGLRPAGDVGTGAAPGLDQAAHDQDPDRLAHRRPAGTENPNEVALRGKASTLRENLRGDELLYLYGNVLRRARPGLAPLGRLPLDAVPQTFVGHWF
jgi:hypothetical protein